MPDAVNSNVIDSKTVELNMDISSFQKNCAKAIDLLDRLQTALTFEGLERSAASTMESVQDSINNLRIDDINKAASQVSDHFTVWGNTLEEVRGIAAKFIAKELTIIPRIIGNTSKTLLGMIKSGGMSRALNIEAAKFQLTGLKISWTKALEDINYGVQDTAYGLDAAAKAASQLSASGVALGDDMKAALRGISGVAAMTNTSYENIAYVYQAVAGMGRATAQTLNRLSLRGVNAYATIAKSLGKTQEEVREMVSKGQIDFKTFAKAMDDAFGEHAKDANKTFTGALSNMKAALSRIGAEFATPLIDAAKDILNALRIYINNIKKALGPVFKSSAQLIDTAREKIVKFIESLTIDDNAFEGVSQAILRIDNALNSEGFDNAIKVIKTIKDNVDDLIDKAVSIADTLIFLIKPAIDTVYDAFKETVEYIVPFVDEIVDGVTTVVKRLLPVIEPVVHGIADGISYVFYAIRDIKDYATETTDVWRWFSDLISIYVAPAAGVIYKTLITIFQTMINIASQIYLHREAIMKFIIPVVTLITDGIQLALLGVQRIYNIITLMATIAGKYITPVVDAVYDTLMLIHKYLSNVIGGLKGLFSVAITTLKGPLMSGTKFLVDLVIKGLKGVNSFLSSDLFPKMRTFAQNAAYTLGYISGLAQKILRNSADGISSIAEFIGKGFLGVFKNFFHFITRVSQGVSWLFTGQFINDNGEVAHNYLEMISAEIKEVAIRVATSVVNIVIAIFNALPEKVRSTIIKAFNTAFFALTVVIGGVITIVEKATAAFEWLNDKVSKFVAWLSSKTGVEGDNLLIIVKILTTVVIPKIVTTVDFLRKKLGDFFTWIKDKLGLNSRNFFRFVDLVKTEYIPSLVEKFKMAADVFRSFTGWLGELTGVGGEGFDFIVKLVRDHLVPALTNAFGTFVRLFNTLKPIVERVLANAIFVFKNLAETIVKYVIPAIGKVKDVIEEKLQVIGVAFNIFTAILGQVTEVGGYGFTTLVRIFERILIPGIANGMQVVEERFEALLTWLGKITGVGGEGFEALGNIISKVVIPALVVGAGLLIRFVNVITNSILPALSDAISFITDLFIDFTAWLGKISGVGGSGLKVFTDLLLYRFVPKVIEGFIKVINLFNQVTTWIKKITGVDGQGLTVYLNLITQVILPRLAEGLGYVYAKLTQFTEWLGKITGVGGSGFQVLVDIVTKRLIPALQTAYGAVTWIFNKVTSVIGEVTGVGGSGLQTIADVATKIVVPAFTKAFNTIKTQLFVVKKLFDIFTYVLGRITGVGGIGFTTLARVFVTFFVPKIVEGVKTILGWFGSFMTWLGEFTGVGGEGFKVVANIVSKLLLPVIANSIKVVVGLASVIITYVIPAVTKVFGFLHEKFMALTKWLGKNAGTNTFGLRGLVDFIFNVLIPSVATGFSNLARDIASPAILKAVDVVKERLSQIKAWFTKNKEAVKAFFEGVKTWFGNAVTFVKTKFSQFVGWLGGVLDTVNKALSTFADFVVKQVIPGIVGAFKFAVTTIKVVGLIITQFVLPLVVDGFKRIVDAVKSFGGSVIDAVVPAITTAFNFVKDKVIAIGKWFLSIDYKKIVDKVKGALDTAGDFISKGVTKIGQFFTTHVLPIVSSVATFVTTKFGQVKDWFVKNKGAIKEFFESVKGWFGTAITFVRTKFDQFIKWFPDTFEKVKSTLARAKYDFNLLMEWISDATGVGGKGIEVLGRVITQIFIPSILNAHKIIASKFEDFTLWLGQITGVGGSGFMTLAKIILKYVVTAFEFLSDKFNDFTTWIGKITGVGKSGFQSLADVFTKIVLPSISSAIDHLKGKFNDFTTWIGETTGVGGSGFVVFADVITKKVVPGLVTAYTKVKNAVVGIKDVFDTITSAIGIVTGVGGSGFTVFGRLITQKFVPGIVNAFKIIGPKFEEVTTWIGEVTGVGGTGFEALANVITKRVVPAFTSVFSFISDKFTAFTTWIGQITGVGGSGFQTLADVFTKIVVPSISAAIDYLKIKFNQFTTWIGELAGVGGSGFKALADAFTQVGLPKIKEVFDNFIGWFKGLFAAMQTTYIEGHPIVNGILGFLSYIGESAYNLVTTILPYVMKVIGGTKNLFGVVIDALFGVPSSAGEIKDAAVKTLTPKIDEAVGAAVESVGKAKNINAGGILNFFDSIFGVATVGAAELEDAGVGGITENVEKAVTNAVSNVDPSGTISEAAQEKAQQTIGDIGGSFSSIVSEWGKKAVGFFSDDATSVVSKVFKILLLILTAIRIIKIFKFIGKIIGSVVGGMFTPVAANASGILNSNAKALLEIAAAISLIIASVTLMTRFADFSEMGLVVAFVAAVAAGLVTISILLSRSKQSKITENLDWLTLLLPNMKNALNSVRDFFRTTQWSAMIAALGLSAISLAAGIKIFTTIKFRDGIKAAVMYGVFLWEIVTASKAMKDIKHFRMVPLVMALSIGSLALGIKLFNSIGWMEALKAAGIYGIFMGELVAVSFIMKKLHLEKFQKFSLSFAISLPILAFGIKSLKDIPFTDAVKVIGEALLFFAGVALVLKFIDGAATSVVKAITSIVVIAELFLALEGLSLTLALLSLFDTKKMDEAAMALAKIGLVMAAMIAASALTKHASKINMILITALMASVVAGLVVLSGILDEDTIGRLGLIVSSIQEVLTTLTIVLAAGAIIGKTFGNAGAFVSTFNIMLITAFFGGMLYLFDQMNLFSDSVRIIQLSIITRIVEQFLSTITLVTLVAAAVTEFTGKWDLIGSTAALGASIAIITVMITGLLGLIGLMDEKLFGGGWLSTAISTLPQLAELFDGLGKVITDGWEALLAISVMSMIIAALDKFLGNGAIVWGAVELGLTISAVTVIMSGLFHFLGWFNDEIMDGKLAEGIANGIPVFLSVLDGIGSIITKLGEVLGETVGTIGGSVVGSFEGSRTSSRLNALSGVLGTTGESIKTFLSDITINITDDVLTKLTSFADAINTLSKSGGNLFGFYNLNNGLTTLSTSLPTFVEAISGITDEEVQRISEIGTALGTFADLANNLPDAGGIRQVFLGYKDLGGFGEDVGDVGEGLARFYKALTLDDEGNMIEFNNNYIKNAAVAAQTLAGIYDYLPNMQMLFDKITGLNAMETFSEDLATLGAGLRSFYVNSTGTVKGGVVNTFKEALFGSAKETDVDDLESMAKAAKSLAKIYEYLPDIGGLSQSIFGWKDLKTFGADLETLGKGLRQYYDAIVGDENSGEFKYKVVTNSARAARALAQLENELPSTGGKLQSWIGTKDIGGFGERISTFATNLSEFITTINNMPTLNKDKDSAAQSITTVFTELQDKLPKQDSKLAKWIFGEKNISAFGTKIKEFAQSIVDYTNKIKEIDYDESNKFTTFLSGFNGFFAEIDYTNFENVYWYLDQLLVGIINYFLDHPDEVNRVKEFGETVAKSIAAGFGTDTTKENITAGVKGLLTNIGKAVIDKELDEAYDKLSSAILAKLLSGFVVDATKKNNYYDIAASNVISQIAQSIAKRLQDIQKIGEFIGKGITLGLTGQNKKVSISGKRLGESAIAGLADGAETHSPSKAAEEVAYFIGDGLLIGLENIEDPVYQKARIIGKAATDGVKDGIEEIDVDKIIADRKKQQEEANKKQYDPRDPATVLQGMLGGQGNDSFVKGILAAAINMKRPYEDIASAFIPSLSTQYLNLDQVTKMAQAVGLNAKKLTKLIYDTYMTASSTTTGKGKSKKKKNGEEEEDPYPMYHSWQELYDAIVNPSIAAEKGVDLGALFSNLLSKQYSVEFEDTAELSQKLFEQINEGINESGQTVEDVIEMIEKVLEEDIKKLGLKYDKEREDIYKNISTIAAENEEAQINFTALQMNPNATDEDLDRAYRWILGNKGTQDAYKRTIKVLDELEEKDKKRLEMEAEIAKETARNADKTSDGAKSASDSFGSLSFSSSDTSKELDKVSDSMDDVAEDAEELPTNIEKVLADSQDEMARSGYDLGNAFQEDGWWKSFLDGSESGVAGYDLGDILAGNTISGIESAFPDMSDAGWNLGDLFNQGYEDALFGEDGAGGIFDIGDKLTETVENISNLLPEKAGNGLKSLGDLVGTVLEDCGINIDLFSEKAEGAIGWISGLSDKAVGFVEKIKSLTLDDVATKFSELKEDFVKLFSPSSEGGIFSDEFTNAMSSIGDTVLHGYTNDQGEKVTEGLYDLINNANPTSSTEGLDIMGNIQSKLEEIKQNGQTIQEAFTQDWIDNSGTTPVYVIGGYNSPTPNTSSNLSQLASSDYTSQQQQVQKIVHQSYVPEGLTISINKLNTAADKIVEVLENPTDPVIILDTGVVASATASGVGDSLSNSATLRSRGV